MRGTGRAMRLTNPRKLAHFATAKLRTPHNAEVCISQTDRDRGTPHGAAPPTPPGIRVAYHGGSTGLSRGRNIESGETE
jgi:hypothetical protein